MKAIYACDQCIKDIVDIHSLSNESWYEGKCNVCKKSQSYLIEASMFKWFNDNFESKLINGKKSYGRIR